MGEVYVKIRQVAPSGAGNAPLEQVVMALRVTAGVDCDVDARHLTDLCRLVAAAAGEYIPVRQPIVGRAVFEHESGVHVYAMQRDPPSPRAPWSTSMT